MIDLWMIWAAITTAYFLGFVIAEKKTIREFEDGVRAERTATKYCPTCKAWKEATSNKPHHLFHGIATFVTGGAWAVVWVGTTAYKWNNVWYCKECHGPALDEEPKS